MKGPLYDLYDYEMIDFDKITRKDICENILLALKYNGMSQRELAKKLSVSPATVSLWLKGNTPLTIETLMEIAKILRLPSSYFLENKKRLEKNLSLERKLSETFGLQHKMEWLENEIINYALSTNNIGKEELSLLLKIYKIIIYRVVDTGVGNVNDMTTNKQKEQDQ